MNEYNKVTIWLEVRSQKSEVRSQNEKEPTKF